MALIAHRGLKNKNIKENTLEAFINAQKNNYGIELDIRKTKDNKIVVLHDVLINRTSNGKGLVKNLKYKELKKYNFGTKKYPAKIPLLKEVLENIKNSKIIIELKDDFTKEELEKVLNNNKNDIYICSFFKHHLEQIKGINYKIGLINYLLNSNIDYKKYDFYLLYYKYYNKIFFKRLETNKKELFLYGIKDFNTIKNTKYYNKDLNYIVEE